MIACMLLLFMLPSEGRLGIRGGGGAGEGGEGTGLPGQKGIGKQ